MFIALLPPTKPRRILPAAAPLTKSPTKEPTTPPPSPAQNGGTVKDHIDKWLDFLKKIKDRLRDKFDDTPSKSSSEEENGKKAKKYSRRRGNGRRGKGLKGKGRIFG